MSLQPTPNPLRRIFTDLMAYALFFEATCAERDPALPEVREKVVALIDPQERRVRAGEVPWESYQEARFAVLSWVDELILNSQWARRDQWQHLMLTYYGTLNAGEEFFRRLEKLPSGARDVREVYYLCLSLGFQGKYAFGANPHELRELRRALYRQLCAGGNDIRQSYQRLFPEAYQRATRVTGQKLPGSRALWFGVALLVPLLLFVTYWLILRRETARLLALIEKPTIVVQQPIESDWLRSLVQELRRRGIEARETPRGVLITLPDLLFEVNRSDLSRTGEAKIEEIAIAVKRHAAGRGVLVDGHASRERSVREEHNQRLSEDRAKRVADAFAAYGLRNERIIARGYGSSRPVAPNDTEEGRRRNRRVEIMVER